VAEGRHDPRAKVDVKEVSKYLKMSEMCELRVRSGLRFKGRIE